MELKRVVVTGLGALTPVGNTVPETWENIKNGVSGAGPITHFDASKFKTQFACEVKGFKATDFIDRKEARKMDLYEQYALVAAMEAIKDSGWDLETIDKNRIGVVLGVGIGGIHTFEEEAGYYAINKENGPKFNPFFIPKMIADIAAGQISIQYGFHGPNYTTTSACASSTNALADAFNLIRLGKADAHHITASHPEGLGANLVMKAALEDAEMKPEDIDYINVHGTSTPVGDISEVKAITKLFGQHAYELNISSTKSMTGHLLGAAGAVEALICCLSVQNDIVPPTINHEDDDRDENIDYNLNFTFNKAQKRTVRAALSNTFGFGGHNACCIVKKYEA